MPAAGLHVPPPNSYELSTNSKNVMSQKPPVCTKRASFIERTRQREVRVPADSVRRASSRFMMLSKPMYGRFSVPPSKWRCAPLAIRDVVNVVPPTLNPPEGIRSVALGEDRKSRATEMLAVFVTV